MRMRMRISREGLKPLQLWLEPGVHRRLEELARPEDMTKNALGARLLVGALPPRPAPPRRRKRP
jgi:hypothetical protein